MSSTFDCWTAIGRHDDGDFFFAMILVLMLGNILYWGVLMGPYTIYKHCYKAARDQRQEGVRQLDNFDLEWSHEAGDLYGAVEERKDE